MSLTYGHWHGVAIELNTDDAPEVADLMHPSACSWSFTHHPRMVDTAGKVLNEMHFTQRHTCDLQEQIDEWGTDGFPDVPGFYWVRMEHYVSPSTPSAYPEYEAAIEWVETARPTLRIEPAAVGLTEETP